MKKILLSGWLFSIILGGVLGIGAWAIMDDNAGIATVFGVCAAFGSIMTKEEESPIKNGWNIREIIIFMVIPFLILAVGLIYWLIVQRPKEALSEDTPGLWTAIAFVYFCGTFIGFIMRELFLSCKSSSKKNK